MGKRIGRMVFMKARLLIEAIEATDRLDGSASPKGCTVVRLQAQAAGYTAATFYAHSRDASITPDDRAPSGYLFTV